MAQLRFGTGGLPHTIQGKGTEAGIARLAELGLEHMELEFVRSVFIKPEKADAVREAAEKHDITLSVHGSYFVNLASPDKQKWHAGINRIISAAHVGQLVGAKSVTYHSGFIQKQPIEEVHERVVEGTAKIINGATEKGADLIKISPELTGKPSQYGSVEELIKINKDLKEAGLGDRIRLCIDFAHNYARTTGGYNSYEEVMGVIELVAKELGSEVLEDLHIHMSAIEYTDKGEKNHLLFFPEYRQYQDSGVEVEGMEEIVAGMPEKRLAPNEFAWKEVLRALHKSGVGGFVVCESPVLELDALVMQKYYRSL